MSNITAMLGSILLSTSVLPLPKIIEAGRTSQDRGLLLLRGERLVGTDLFDSTGARLGRIDDLVFEARGNVSHVVLQGDVGGQPRLVPVPWSALTFPASFQPGMENPTDKVTTNFSSTRLQTAPNFDSSQWPKDGQDSVFAEADAFFKSGAARDGGIALAAPSIATPPVGPRFRASRIRNSSVFDDSGKPLGSLNQLVIDSNSGRIAYATMTIPSPASPRVIAVPWETFTASRQNNRDRMQLALPMDRLQSAPEFQAGTPAWKQMSDPAWVSSMYSFYSARPYWSSSPSNTPSREPTSPANEGRPTQPSRP